MKVLWFSNTPANSEEYYNDQVKGRGGWLKSLDAAVQNKIELHVAFYHSHASDSFKYKNTTYHPIKHKTKLFQKIFNKIIYPVINQEDELIYFDLIHKIKPDIIHIHGTENPFGCIINKVKIPIVVSIQGNITVYLHKFCTGIEEKYLNVKVQRTLSIKSLFFRFSFKKQYKMFFKMQFREEINLRKCKFIIGRTSWDRRISKILAPNSLYFHNDEILRNIFYSKKWKYQLFKKLMIFTTNGNNYYKGFETLCLSLNILNKLDMPVVWSVAGINENDLIVKIVKQKLGKQYPKKGLQLLGKLNAKDLVEELLKANLYVMTSHIENSPNNLCEAMILGMPCIATNAGGTSSLLKDGTDGILIQDGDPWVMAGAVMELKEDFKKAIFFGENARKRAIKRHNKEKIVLDLLKIYKNLLFSVRL